MEMWKSQKQGFPHFHRLGGYDEKKEKNQNQKTGPKSVKYVPGLKCKTCPRLHTGFVVYDALCSESCVAPPPRWCCLPGKALWNRAKAL
jgi:hypothetical protein